ncbi:hypothetical protein DMN91_010823 [Ooceraea biroi]|uniref:Reverse transcriptase domain-containing protein n=1 Tax=Ooceraea biroi TaxID=2015173 RepID=A0A3L8D8E5_OOCBI|nr:hypothetical protein DMN91_010823 [Ooceraea biroi]
MPSRHIAATVPAIAECPGCEEMHQRSGTAFNRANMDAPLEVVLAYPIESRVVCPRCWGSGELGVRTRGDFCDPPHLAKHQKAKHPGDTITYKCSLCEFRGSGRYPLKAVKAHYDREHGGHRDESPATVAGADAGRAQNSGRARVGSASNAGVRTRAAALPGTSSVGAADSRRLRRNLPAATPSPQQTPLAATTTASTTTGRSPSYAAVTAGPSTRPVRAPSLTAGAGGAAVAATRTTTARRSSTAVRRGAIGTAATAATGATPPIAGIAGGSSDASSAERRRPWRPPVPVPVCSACGVPTRLSGTPPQPNPLRVTRSARVPPHKPSNTSSGGTGGAPSVKRRQKGAARPVHVSPRSPQTIAESQQTIGASRGGNRSGGSPPAAATTSAAALVGAPSAPVAKSTPERTVASRGTAKRSTRSPPATTIAAAAAGVATRRHARRKASQFGVEPGGVWRRGFRTPTPPSSPEGFSEVQVAGVLGRRSATPTARAPTPAVPAQLRTTTTRSTRAGTRAATSSAAAATSSPATLVTCTVTTSVCGAPVMSTGVPSAALRPVPRLEGLQPEEHRPTTPPVGPARIQALFRRNRRKAVREVVQGPADFCQVQGRTVQEHFERLYGGGERLDGLPAVEPVDHSRPEDVALLMAPFTEGEVDRRLRRMTNSAPGPDGIAYNDLRAADPGARLLTALFNACYRLEAVPPSWKTSNTVLVYKKGDRDSLESWRPLALGDTMPKLFAAVAADRLTDWVIANDKLCRAQKGFLRDEGCYEHNFVLQEILTDARRTRRHAVVAWLDLSNAFGSVPHAAIRSALVRAGVPSGLINIWGSMYDGCTTRVRAVDGFTAPIPIRSGVRQGCPLSPIIFDLVIDSVVRAAAELADVGYDILGQTFNILAYADDLALIARTPEGMRQLLTAVELEAGRVGLHFNPAKCASLHITTGRIGRVLPTVFEIEGRPMPTLAEGEPYRHLGVPTGFSVDQTPLTTIEGVLKDIWAVDASLLAPWQRVEVLAAFILPRLDFLLRGAAVEKRPLRAVDLHVRRIVKSWLNLPQRASAEVVYLPPSRGGCGLLPLSDLADVLTIAHAFRLLTASDAVVSGLAWGSLRGVVARRIGHAPSDEEIASFLSGSLEGRLRGGGEASLWSRARNAARRQANRAAVRWRWSEVTGEMIVECRGPGERIVRVPGSARAQVIHRLRSAVMEYYAGTLLRKPDQGKVFEVSSRVPVSNHFMRGGSFTRFADWRFVHRARLDVLPLNGARRWGTVDERCRRCGRTAETLPHVIGHCGVHAAAIQLRHDAVLHRLRRACRLPGEVRVNQRVEGVDGELEGLRPDLVVRHEPSKSVVICDVTVAFENRLVAFEEARGRKVARYTPLAEALRAQGYRVVVTALVVGALGSWCPRNDAVLRLLRVGSKYGSMMRRLIVSDTIRWSRDIYVEHVSGVRQYPAPPRPSGDGGPLVSPPLAIRRRYPDGLLAPRELDVNVA